MTKRADPRSRNVVRRDLGIDDAAKHKPRLSRKRTGVPRKPFSLPHQASSGVQARFGRRMRRSASMIVDDLCPAQLVCAAVSSGLSVEQVLGGLGWLFLTIDVWPRSRYHLLQPASHAAAVLRQKSGMSTETLLLPSCHDLIVLSHTSQAQTMARLCFRQPSEHHRATGLAETPSWKNSCSQ